MAVTAAQLNVIISATGAKEVISDLNQIDGQVKKAAGGFDAFYDRIGGGAGNALRALDGVARVMGSIAIIGGVSLIAGGARAAWDQVSAVEQATVALRAYEKDASAVDRVLKELIDYARSDMGVLFQRQDLFNAAQGLRMYGAETQNLTEYVKIMSRSVGLGLSTWEDLNRVLGRIGSTGRLAGDDFDYLRAAGFRLDDSLRNTNITFEELFAAMDRGIPANALEGQSETIRGAMIRLQSGIRNIGLAFLDVDADTSKFVEGGLGDKLRTALFDARGWIDNFVDAAGTIGGAIATAIEAVESLAAAYQSLPGWLQTSIEWILKAVTAFGALRVAASSLGMVMNVAGLGGMIGGVQALVGSFAAAGGGALGFRAALTSLVAGFGPVGIALTVVGAGLAIITSAWGDQQREAKKMEDALSSLSDSYYDLIIARNDALLSGNNEMAANFDQLRMQIQSVQREADAFRTNADHLIATNQITAIQYVEMRESYKLTEAHVNSLADSQGKLQTAFQDTRIDSQALTSDIDDLYWSFMRQEITLDQYVAGMADISENTSRYAIEVDGATDSVNEMTDALDGLTGSQRSFNLEMAQMRIDGDGAMADTLIRLNDLFGENSRASGVAAEYVEFFSSNVASGNFDLDNYAIGIERLNWLYDQGLISQVMYDRAITSMTMSATEAASATRTWEDALRDGLVQGTETATAAIEELNERVAENREALLDIAGFGDPLSQWNLSGNATDMSLLAMNTQQAATALESVFRIAVGNTNAFAQQAQSVEAWITSLTMAEEGLTSLQELQNAGLITQGQYNAAMEASNDIQAANASIQQDVLAIQAMQAPIIAAHTTALADQLSIIRQLPAEQQRIALGWMDSATAMQAMEFQTLAVAAATGQLGANGDVVFANMIAGAAAANPYLSAILEDMGLISVGADGTITVHLSGVSEGLSEIDRLTVAMVNMLDLMDDGELNMSISFDTLGLEDPRVKLEGIEDVVVRVDGSVVNINAELHERGGGGDGSIAGGVDHIVTSIRNHYANDPITIPVTLDTSGISGASSVGSSLGGAAAGALGASGISITVTADTSSFDASMIDVNAARSILISEPAVTVIDANTTRADQMITAVNRRLDEYDSRVSTTTLDANTVRADQMVTAINSRLNIYAARLSTTTLDANTIRANQAVTAMNERLNTYDARVSTTTLDANSASAHEVIRLLMNRLDEVDGLSARVHIYANDYASSAIDKVSRGLSNLDGRSATTYTNQVQTTIFRTVGSSIGGSLPGYADGGIVRDPVVMVGERGPELVALPYGSEVFSNTESMRMLRQAASRAPMPVASNAHRPSSGTQYIDNSTHTTEYIALTESDFQQLLAKSERGNAAYGHMSSRQRPRRYEGSL